LIAKSICALADGVDEIELRIMHAAIELAVSGGIDAVRQRDLAARSGVALGTLYSRFPSKHLVLVSALELEAQELERELAQKPITGRTPEARLRLFFERTTQRFVGRPNLGRAIIRAAASGNPECTTRLMRYQARITELAAQALRGSGSSPLYDREAAQQAAGLLIMVWFACLVGWSGGAASPEVVVAVVENSAKLVLHGVARRGRKRSVD
jgi:AcrR family transcriptional regulator